MTYLTTAQAAPMLNVQPATVKRWCQVGKVAGAIKPGHDWLIPAQSIDNLERKPSRWDERNSTMFIVTENSYGTISVEQEDMARGSYIAGPFNTYEEAAECAAFETCENAEEYAAGHDRLIPE